MVGVMNLQRSFIIFGFSEVQPMKSLGYSSSTMKLNVQFLSFKFQFSKYLSFEQKKKVGTCRYINCLK